MACPYFMPVSKLENGSWPHPSRLPLGCGWSGHCTAPGHEGITPPQQVLERFCNLGYVSSCGWSPAVGAWDAVRFAISAPRGSIGRDLRPMASSDAPNRILCLMYVCERDHHPVTQGELKFDLTTTTWLLGHYDPRIQKMAECFLDSYLKKKA
ncbi:MAG TPA: hypothetical protein VFO46_09410 [Candidatus Sulfotelmatobacter sp.]|nr:hypothetical protein [Candidatus Sulfotelmatobacter sp.]